jgi:hypothetical protein
MRKQTIVIFALLVLSANRVRALDIGIGVAKEIEVKGSNVFDGALICSSNTGFEMCKSAFAPTIYGVMVASPAAMIDTELEGVFVLTDGMADVRVSDKNGEVLKDDFVTSSESLGLAMKAKNNGFVLGRAIEAVRQLPTGEKMVRVAIQIHPEAQLSSTRSNLISILRDAGAAPLLEPLAAFRYALAALLVVISFSLGFVYFGRMANTGVEAIGRNPLAEGLIRRNIILHVLVTIVIVGVGLFASYLVLIL